MCRWMRRYKIMNARISINKELNVSQKVSQFIYYKSHNKEEPSLSVFFFLSLHMSARKK